MARHQPHRTGWHKGPGLIRRVPQTEGGEMTATYKERVNRWRILRHEELPERHKAEYRLNGIDPDDCWSLIWSFETEEDAVEMLAHLNETKRDYQTYKLVDGGAATEIERSVW